MKRILETVIFACMTATLLIGCSENNSVKSQASTEHNGDTDSNSEQPSIATDENPLITFKMLKENEVLWGGRLYTVDELKSEVPKLRSKFFEINGVIHISDMDLTEAAFDLAGDLEQDIFRRVYVVRLEQKE